MSGAGYGQRFALFVLMGALGVVVHRAVLAPLYLNHRHRFPQAPMIAMITAMFFNFLLNNIVIFRDWQLRGWRLLAGLLIFYAACSLVQ